MADIDVSALVKTYGQQVYNLAYRITGNQDDAEDVTQETFLQVHRGKDAFRGNSAVYTWIYRIAVNASLQTKRRLDKSYLDSLEDTIAQFRDDVPEEVRRWEHDPENQYLYEELLEEVQRACYHFITFRLTDEQRVVYVLRVVLGFSLEDISAILQADKNTVKARLQRAKTALGSYFRGRCQWVEGAADCSCESRLGFGLSVAPEILKRLQNRAPNVAMKNVVRRPCAASWFGGEGRKRLEQELVRIYQKRKALLGSRLLRTAFSTVAEPQTRAFLRDRTYFTRVSYLLDQILAGDDPIFYSAPAIVLVHAPGRQRPGGLQPRPDRGNHGPGLLLRLPGPERHQYQPHLQEDTGPGPSGADLRGGGDRPPGCPLSPGGSQGAAIGQLDAVETQLNGKENHTPMNQRSTRPGEVPTTPQRAATGALGASLAAFFRGALRTSLTRPGQAVFFLRTVRRQLEAARLRSKWRADARSLRE